MNYGAQSKEYERGGGGGGGGGEGGGGADRKRNRGRVDTMSTIEFMTSSALSKFKVTTAGTGTTPNDVFADVQFDHTSRFNLARFVKRFKKQKKETTRRSEADDKDHHRHDRTKRKEGGGEEEVAREGEGRVSAFSKDLERIKRVTDDDVEQLVSPGTFETASELTRAVLRVAGAGMNVAIISASVRRDQREAVRYLAESAAGLGVPCVIFHGTRNSFLTFPTTSSTSISAAPSVVHHHVLPHILSLGTTLDTMPAEMAARVIRKRFVSELAVLVKATQRPLVIIEDVFSLSRAALARAEAIISALFRIESGGGGGGGGRIRGVTTTTSSAGAASTRWGGAAVSGAGWGGAQVVVSGCPIRSIAPLQLRKTDDFDFLPCTVEWERWFPITVELKNSSTSSTDRLQPGRRWTTTKTAAAAHRLLQMRPTDEEAHELRANIISKLFVRPVAPPAYLSPFPGTCTIVASQGLADSRMRKEMERIRARGGNHVQSYPSKSVLEVETVSAAAVATTTIDETERRDTQKKQKKNRRVVVVPSPISDPAGYESALSAYPLRKRAVVPDFVHKDVACQVVNPVHFDLYEQVRQILRSRFYPCNDEFAKGVLVAFTFPPERKGLIGVVESVNPEGEAEHRASTTLMTVRCLNNSSELVDVKRESFEFRLEDPHMRLRVSCVPVVPITYVPLDFAAYLDLDVWSGGMGKRFEICVDPFSMEKSPTSPLAIMASSSSSPSATAAAGLVFHRTIDEELLMLKDDLASAARYMEVCVSTEGDADFESAYIGGGGEVVKSFRYRSSSRTRLEFLKRGW